MIIAFNIPMLESGALGKTRTRDLLNGKLAAEESLLFYARRLDETNKSLDAMRLQYPEYAKVLERRHLGRLALRMEQLEYQNMREQAMISQEVFNDLQTEFHARL